MKNKKKTKTREIKVNFATASRKELLDYATNFAKSYKPSPKNDLVSYIRRERGYRN